MKRCDIRIFIVFVLFLLLIVSTAATSPASITGLSNVTGNFYQNWSWVNPVDSDFNGTMIYINGNFVTNLSNTTTSYNLTSSAHNTSTISVRTVDISGNMNESYVNQTTTIPNNPVIISGLEGTPYSVNEGDAFIETAICSDADGDTCTFADNSSVWNVNYITGDIVWQTGYTNAGTYYWYVNVSDGYGSVSTADFVVTVNDVPWEGDLPKQPSSLRIEQDVLNLTVIWSGT